MRGRLASLGFVLLLIGCASARQAGRVAARPVSPVDQAAPRVQQLWILDSGWHTGLILPRNELGAALADLAQDMPAARYFVFGWGNRKFYMAPRPSVLTGLGALFPSRSAVLVGTCDVPPPACFDNRVRLDSFAVSRAGVARLDHFLARSLRRNAAGGFEPMGPGPDPGSEFFASPLSYDALHTCNTWTAQALHVAGLPVSDQGVIFAGQLWRQVAKARP